MRVHVVDPPAYTPPYDRALAAALARAGAGVTLVTAPFRHGEVPPALGYEVRETFYRRALPRPLQHVPDMLAYAAARRRDRPDVVHWQWAAIQELDWALTRLGPRGVRVLTAHDVLPRVARPLQTAGQRRLYAGVDAVVAHTEHGRRRLVAEAGVDPARVHVIPHGAFTHLSGLVPTPPPELAATGAGAGGPPAALLFGLLKPYKGLDVLYDAWRRLEVPARLWVVGAPRMALPDPPPGVTVVPRFVTDAEAAWCLREAALTVLPYRDIEMSGVLFSALGLGRPLLLSDVGGFPEVTAAAHVPAGDAPALAAELTRLLGEEDGSALRALAQASAAAAATSYAWDDIAARHLALYRSLGAA
ncbi:glycosyltransferase family 4 protein [Paraconexibacter antarcticus]|uniref:Glycosyltransferase family 4 protein n=1 Tax=Paraconexibacter antarcticus TaxID=2949664 RepID=A0ABY5DTC0_9ACTN|nr:glycosyltransferase family 4 protein [Paraconexibacter antarcticus]UTI64720.1 glycosyltransferase family 4 protein [Paraconexibacter antarcticus]